MTEPSVSNPSLDSNRFGMSSNSIQPQTTLATSNNSSCINIQQQQQESSLGNQIGILDILSSSSSGGGGGGNNSSSSQQMMKGSFIPFSSNQSATISSSNSIRTNLNSSSSAAASASRKSLPSTSTLSPYQLQSSLESSSFSPRFARQFSQPPLSFQVNNEQDITTTITTTTITTTTNSNNNEELSGGEEEEMNPPPLPPPLLAKTNDVNQQQQQTQPPPPSNSTGTGNSRRMNYACTECRKAHKACTGERPCDRCKKLGMEDKCKSSVRKKRILTKRYWVHFMSNDGSNNTNSMMDDSSIGGDQSPSSIQNVFPGQPQMGNPKSASMNFKRHSSANLPSFSSVKRLNQGLSGGSSNSMSSISFQQGSEIMSSNDGVASMLNPNEYNMYSGGGGGGGGGDRSPRQAPHSYNYHPYRSPRQHPSGGEAIDHQTSPNTLQNNSNGNAVSGTINSTFASPRNNRATSSSQITTPQMQPQQSNYAFSGLDAYRLPPNAQSSNSVESSPRESNILNHLNVSSINNSAGSQLDTQTVNRHYNRGSMRIQPLFNQHTKSLSDTNLLPSPSMLFHHQQHHSMFTIPPHQQSNSMAPPLQQSNNMAIDEFSNNNYQDNHYKSDHQSNLHIPPIMFEKNPNVPQFTIQPSPSHSNNSNSNTPRSGIFFESSPRSNIGSGGEYYYSPRSEVDYSSDLSSLTNSPRFGAGGADSNSSTPRSLIGSMTGMSINESTPLSQQLSQQQQQYPPGYRGSLHYDSPSLLGVPGNRKSVAGYLNQAGNRFSLGSVAYHGSAYAQQQQQQNGIPNSSSSSSSYTNHPGNRYSLGPNQDLYQYSTRSTNFRK